MNRKHPANESNESVPAVLHYIVLALPFISVGTLGVFRASWRGFNVSIYDFTALFSLVYVAGNISTLRSIVRDAWRNHRLWFISLVGFLVLAFVAMLHGTGGGFARRASLYYQLVFRNVFVMGGAAIAIGKVNYEEFVKALWMVAVVYVGVTIVLLLAEVLFPSEGLSNFLFEFGEGIGDGSDRKIRRIEGLSDDPNFLSFVLIFVLFLNWSRETRGSGTLVKASVAVVVLALIVLTRSRTGFVVTAVGVLMLVLFQVRDRKIRPIWAGAGVVMLAISGFVLYSIRAQSPFIQGFFRRFSRTMIARAPRWTMISDLSSDLTDRWWFGHGLRSSYHLLGKSSHMTYLEIFYEMGFLALVLFLLFFVATLWMSWRLARRHNEMRVWFLFLLGTILIYALFTHLYWPLNWMIFGVVLGIHSKEKQRAPSAASDSPASSAGP